MTYTFFWSPTGREVASLRAESFAKAKAAFKSMFPSYARFMGEVYWTVS